MVPLMVLLLIVLFVPELNWTPAPRFPEIVFRVTRPLVPFTRTPKTPFVPTKLVEIVFPVTVLLVPPRFTPPRRLLDITFPAPAAAPPTMLPLPPTVTPGEFPEIVLP